jgi:hypothetical protein
LLTISWAGAFTAVLADPHGDHPKHPGGDGSDDEGNEPDDGDQPDHGSVCDGLSGGAFGLCNAFCVAQHCNIEHKHSCDVLRDNFQRQTGLSTFPCEIGPPPLTATPTATPAPGDDTPTATRTRPATATRTSTRTRTASPTSTATFPGGIATATSTPAGDRDVCDDLEEGAHGLCNAFCNAQHCQLDPHPSCEVLRRNFRTQTGSSVFPCEIIGTPSATATIPAGATPTRTPDEDCMGDCDGDHRVTIDDLTKCTAITLGRLPRSDCHSISDRDLTISDLIRAVRHALEGCS